MSKLKIVILCVLLGVTMPGWGQFGGGTLIYTISNVTTNDMILVSDLDDASSCPTFCVRPGESVACRTGNPTANMSIKVYAVAPGSTCWNSQQINEFDFLMCYYDHVKYDGNPPTSPNAAGC